MSCGGEGAAPGPAAQAPPVEPGGSALAAPALSAIGPRLFALGAETTLAVANTGGAAEACAAAAGSPGWLSARLSGGGRGCIVTASPAPLAGLWQASEPLSLGIEAVNAAGRSRISFSAGLLPPPALRSPGGTQSLLAGESAGITMLNSRPYTAGRQFLELGLDVGIERCSSSPGLPAGLEARPTPPGTGCMIVGVPRAASAQASYAITAANAAGASAPVTVDILVMPSQPGQRPSLVNPDASFSYLPGEAVSIVIEGVGGELASCVLYRSSLPPGLAIGVSPDGRGCRIHGVPAASSASSYDVNIVARNSAGHSLASMVLRMLAPPDIQEASAPRRLAVGEEFFVRMADSSPGGISSQPAVFSKAGPGRCWSEPALPAGLTVKPSGDGRGCDIQGAPLATSPHTTYRIYGANAAGSGYGAVKIAVRAADAAPAPGSEAASAVSRPDGSL